MRLLHYLEVRNFKRFGDKQRIELDHPSVLIGPNNCGKTAAIQAIALWSQAVKTWYDNKGKAPSEKTHGNVAQPAEHRFGSGSAHPLFLAQHRRPEGQPEHPADRLHRPVA